MFKSFTVEENTWVTSDTHFGDERSLQFCDRPFKDVNEMNDEIVRRWNSVIQPEDTVYHLGDICTYKSNLKHLIGYGNQLNGKKFLLLGNHDMNFKESDLLRVFEDVYTEPFRLLYEDYYYFCCHYPVQRNLDYYTLTGHIHDKWRVARKMLNVGMDVHNFTPLSMKKVARFWSIENEGHWDANVYPDAPLEWRLKVTGDAKRPDFEPTRQILQQEKEQLGL